MKQRRKRIWRGAILALAVAAIAAPAAQARPYIENWGTSVSYTTGAYGAPSAIGLGPKLDQAGSAQSVSTSEYKTGEYGAPSAIALSPKVDSVSSSQSIRAQSIPVRASGSGFDWTDGTIGAGIAFAVSILLIGTAMSTRRRETRVAV